MRRPAAEFIRKFVTKPVVAYIAGVTAPPGKRMGQMLARSSPAARVRLLTSMPLSKMRASGL